MAPSRPTPKNGTRHATRDQYLQVQTLIQARQNYATIAKITGLTYRQIQYAAINHIVAPGKRSGRPGRLSDKESAELVKFVTTSEENLRMPYSKIAEALGWTCGWWVIRNALAKAGFAKYRLLRKPLRFKAT